MCPHVIIIQACVSRPQTAPPSQGAGPMGGILWRYGAKGGPYGLLLLLNGVAGCCSGAVWYMACRMGHSLSTVSQRLSKRRTYMLPDTILDQLPHSKWAATTVTVILSGSELCSVLT
jgi:hypothetical protein